MSKTKHVHRIALLVFLLVSLCVVKAKGQPVSAVSGASVAQIDSSMTNQEPAPDTAYPSSRLAQDALPPVAAYGLDAQTGDGTYLTYQGRLTDNAGVPVTTSVGIVFKLYDAGNTLLYTSGTHTVTPVEGMFTAHIGAPPDPALTNTALRSIAEIGVTVGSDPEMTPRQSINTVIGSSVSGIGVAGNSQDSYGVYGTSTNSFGVRGESDLVGVFGYSENGLGLVAGSKSNTGITGYTESISPTRPGVYGINNSTGLGVYGTSEGGIGVSGYTDGAGSSAAGVYGENSGNGYGVYGLGNLDAGVYGESATDVGVAGYSQDHSGVDGFSQTSFGVYGTSGSFIGVGGIAQSDSRAGVFGYNTESGPGVEGSSADGVGVYGHVTSDDFHIAGVYGNNDGPGGSGVFGRSTTGSGLYGESLGGGIGVSGYTSSTLGFGVKGDNGGSGTGVFGYSAQGTGISGHGPNHIGVFGGSETGIGVSGYTSSTSWTLAGVYGKNDGTGAGVYGISDRGQGVHGDSLEGVGVDGFSLSGIGVVGHSPERIGVAGFSDSDEWYYGGVVGHNYDAGPGVRGYSDNGPGVYGVGIGGIGVYGRTITGTASGYFSATNPSTAAVVMINEGTSPVLHLVNAGSDSDGSGGGHFIEAANSDETDVQFRVTTSGEIQSDGAHTTPAADFAEMLPAVAGVEPADVLVIGTEGRLMRSTEPYQATVVGVYSTEPGFIGGHEMDGNPADEVPLAIMGVVPVKVSAENGAIQPGDLLVASATSGHAMCAGANPPIGTVLGKALGSFSEGTGVIQMLVMLQ